MKQKKVVFRSGQDIVKPDEDPFTCAWSKSFQKYCKSSCTHIIVSGSNILCPIVFLSDIEKLVSFERAMFED